MSEKRDASLFKKAMEASASWIDLQLLKAKSEAEKEFDLDLEYQKSVDRDNSTYVGAQGYQEKSYRITNEHLKQMSVKDSIVASIIQTRQNQVAGHSKLVRNRYEKGFRITLKDEEKILEEILDLLKYGLEEDDVVSIITEAITKSENQLMLFKASSKEEDRPTGLLKSIQNKAKQIKAERTELRKAEGVTTFQDEMDEDSLDWKKVRKAKKILKKATEEKKRFIEQFVLNCGIEEQKPFKSKKWNFDSWLRAIIRDSLTLDLFAVEIVRNRAGMPIYFVPVDGGTVKFASPQLGNYKEFPLQSGYDILYPEKELKNLEQKDALELDAEKLEKNEYKYVQVVKGRIERAFTEEELKIGMRNPTTDIMNNGYSISELELLVMLVTSHLNAEYYNQAYFTQGFSAKGILHIKAPLNRRKLQDVRQKWQHMIKGNRNSFQTPIFAGADDVKWIPLTQNHSDIEFQGWMTYLLKMICSIYQIDPQEIGAGIKEEGSKGNGLSGDNTKEKIDLSRDRGLYPLVRFLENFLNVNIVSELDSDFKLEFVGIKDESHSDAIDRQSKEAKFKKTVNEIRAEEGLPPIPGADLLILDNTYLQWYQQFSPDGKKMKDERDVSQQTSDLLSNPVQYPEPVENAEPNVAKSLKIEYYKLK